MSAVLVPADKLRELQANAARYEFLRDRLLAADFDWQESGESVLVFSWPDAPVSADCDATIDAGIQAVEKAKEF